MKNQVVLITGCSSGVGRNLCIELKRRGYHVVASARDINKINNLNVDMKVQIDVTDDRSIEKAVDDVIKQFGRIDILVNNAGYSVRSAVEEMDINETEKMFDVNVYGVLRMIKAVVPFMRKQHNGKIINIGSISGKFAGIINGGYCATKHAIEAITESARYELKSFGIQVAVIEPGAMETEFFHTLARNSNKRMENASSPYIDLYQRDLAYRRNQKHTSVEDSVNQICRIADKNKLKVRYKISLSWVFKVLIHLPDGIKEKLIMKFN